MAVGVMEMVMGVLVMGSSRGLTVVRARERCSEGREGRVNRR